MRDAVTHEGISFNASPAPTVGIEVEMWLVDPHSRELVQAADPILDELAGGSPDGHPKAKHELFRSTIEVITGICSDVGQAGEDLRGTIAEVADAADRRGIELMTSGTHPFSRWQDQQVSPGERYGTFLERLGWPVRRLAINGTHVHVGVSSGQAAVAITGALCEQLPLLLAASASSPFWDGEDTTLASVRTKIFEALPTSGIPPHLDGWDDFEAFMHGLLRAGVIRSIREVWWDIRPHPDFGTVELRMCDATPTLEETLALAALSHCLVVRLERRLAAGERLETPRDWVVAENKWLACRHGLEAELLVGDQGDRRPAGDLLVDLVGELRPLAAELGCATQLESVLDLVAGGVSATRQRRVLAEGGDPRDVVDHLVQEFAGPGGFL